jgi:hypothetical protein
MSGRGESTVAKCTILANTTRHSCAGRPQAP